MGQQENIIMTQIFVIVSWIQHNIVKRRDNWYYISRWARLTTYWCQQLYDWITLCGTSVMVWRDSRAKRRKVGIISLFTARVKSKIITNELEFLGKYLLLIPCLSAHLGQKLDIYLHLSFWFVWVFVFITELETFTYISRFDLFDCLILTQNSRQIPASFVLIYLIVLFTEI